MILNSKHRAMKPAGWDLQLRVFERKWVYFLISKIVAALPIASGKDEEASGC